MSIGITYALALPGLTLINVELSPRFRLIGGSLGNASRRARAWFGEGEGESRRFKPERRDCTIPPILSICPRSKR